MTPTATAMLSEPNRAVLGAVGGSITGQQLAMCGGASL
jgi:hypothetical protein